MSFIDEFLSLRLRLRSGLRQQEIFFLFLFTGLFFHRTKGPLFHLCFVAKKQDAHWL